MHISDTSRRFQVMGGQKERFVRFQSDSGSERSLEIDRGGLGEYVSSSDSFGRTPSSISSSVRRGWEKGSQGLKNIGRSLRFGVSREVFSEDLKSSDKKIFDPQDKFLQKWNKIFVISCLAAVSVDPLFFYLPVINNDSECLDIDDNIAIIATVLRTITDIFYLMHMALQFRTAFIAPSSRVFGRGELVIDPIKIAKRYLSTYFIIDILAVLPLPQVVIWIIMPRMRGSAALNTKNSLRFIVLLQYLPRFIRIFSLSKEVLGACWYFLALERRDTCWREACSNNSNTCETRMLYCEKHSDPPHILSEADKNYFQSYCNASGSEHFDFGIYADALTSRIVTSPKFLQKYFYCLWWGLRNLSSLGQSLVTSTYLWEILFAMFIAILGLVLFALLIGNMQTYLQSLTVRLEEMRVKRRDTEQWMRHRLLPENLRERVRRYDQYKWLETRGVDEETLIYNLPKDLRRDIKRHLCLDLVRRVPLFESMDEQLLDAMCERLKPSLYTEHTYIVTEGDPVDEMLFIIRGHLESDTTNGGRTGFFNRGLLKQGDFCGEELLTWALDPKSGANLPSSTRTVRALTEVEAFALRAEDLKFVASQFRRLHSRQVQHTFRFYSQHWRTWAACFIQAAWRRYCRRKNEEIRRREEKRLRAALSGNGNASPSLGATIYASRFAANALRFHRQRNLQLPERTTPVIKLQKPAEPDFSVEDA
ncbi:probable cyclic nucleotide-gated ion channel 6 isoform X2 [Cryptomeria japonica]|uniref:probable cyclic nucleotide-gated ion channel 6 isoform X2 n=1 Tax=Cryptomeria japonica TaxID=3369 RepID=UPI0027DA4E0B|nr:probable cyclic nucleotide-gated ion channel 6 isoform X2 [Cryptomeria japonica]